MTLTNHYSTSFAAMPKGRKRILRPVVFLTFGQSYLLGSLLRPLQKRYINFLVVMASLLICTFADKVDCCALVRYFTANVCAEGCILSFILQI
jgi:hypothetical protein